MSLPSVVSCIYARIIKMQGLYSPIFTSRMFSLSINLSAMEIFSIFCGLNEGFLLNLAIFLCERTCRRPMSFNPSRRSVSKLYMYLFTHFRCSLHHLVNVFCWIFFHSASAEVGSVSGIFVSIYKDKRSDSP